MEKTKSTFPYKLTTHESYQTAKLLYTSVLFKRYQAQRLSLGSIAFDRPVFPDRSSEMLWSLQHEVYVYGGPYCYAFNAQQRVNHIQCTMVYAPITRIKIAGP